MKKFKVEFRDLFSDALVATVIVVAEGAWEAIDTALDPNRGLPLSACKVFSISEGQESPETAACYRIPGDRIPDSMEPNPQEVDDIRQAWDAREEAVKQ